MEKIINKLQVEIDTCGASIKELKAISAKNINSMNEGAILIQIIELKARKKAFHDILLDCEAELDFELSKQ